MTKFLKAFLLAVILLFALFACSSPQTTEPPLVVPEKTLLPDDIYPPAGQAPSSEESYPGPDPVNQSSVFPDAIEVPQPAPDLGVVTGRILQAGNQEVFLAPTLLLGELVFADDPNAPPLVGYSIETDPVAVQDKTGQFVFKDIKPGKYAIVVWTPLTQSLLMDSQGATAQVIVEAGKIVDLGDVYVP